MDQLFYFSYIHWFFYWVGDSATDRKGCLPYYEGNGYYPITMECSLSAKIMVIIFWDFLIICQTSLSPQVKKCIYELPHKLPNIIRLKILGNWEISGKSQSFIELQPSAQLPSKIESFINTSKKLLKNRNWTLPVVPYFTRKLEFASYFVHDCKKNWEDTQNFGLEHFLNWGKIPVKTKSSAESLHEVNGEEELKNDVTRNIW